MLQSSFLTKFTCLGDACEDTCCKGWSMQLDDTTHATYQREAPELLSAVAEEGGVRIMKRDPVSDYCVKFDNGWCGIHRERGAGMLGDACYFYPRVTRALAGEPVMTATPSCPEIVRLALFSDNAFAHEEHASTRLPNTMKEYLPEGITREQALAAHRAFLDFVLDAESAEHALACIGSVARSMERLPVASWGEAVPFYLKMAASRLPQAEMKAEDPFNLLHALAGLAVATRKRVSDRLKATVGDMQEALGVMLDWETAAIELAEDSMERWNEVRAAWEAQSAQRYPALLKNWLALQLAVALFPFAGLGQTLTERITIIGVRFATLKLALACNAGIAGTIPPQDMVVRVVQSLARVLDHLGDSAYSMQVYTEAGWTHEGRMRGLITWTAP